MRYINTITITIKQKSKETLEGPQRLSFKIEIKEWEKKR